MMNYLRFLLTTFAGFIAGMVCIWIVFPVAFAGEVFSPLLVPFVGASCIVVTSIPFAFLQSRVIFSAKARRAIPVLFGFLWMPFFLMFLVIRPPILMFEEINFWVGLFALGLISSLFVFALSMCLAKAADILSSRLSDERLQDRS